MSRNNDRMGLPEPLMPETGVPPAAIENNSTEFNWSVPTEIVELPSGGKLYPEGHPLHNVSSVEIKYMTAKEEDILTSPSLLREGIAVDRALQNVILDKSIRVDELLIGDKNALVIATRITGYGEDYETSVTCPACGEQDTHSFDLSELGFLDNEAALAEHDITITPKNTFTVNLPLSKATVECRLLTGKDEMKMLKKSKKNAKRKTSTALTDQFSSYIVAVNGETDPFKVGVFIQQMPARDSRYLRKVFAEVSPNIDMKQHFECSSCSYTADLEVPLTADFLWPK